MNRYALTDAKADLRHYAVVVTRTGKDGEKLDSVVYTDPEKKNKVGSKSGTLKSGGTLDVAGLPEKVKVKSNGGFDAKVGFEYAADKSKTNKYFAFDTATKGRWKTSDDTPYCEKKFDAKKDGKVEISCYFPGY